MEPYVVWALAGFGFPAQVVIAAVVATAMTVLDKTKQAQASAQGA